MPLAELAGEAWTTGHAGMGWDEMTRRTCHELGGFEPDVRHRTNDATISLAVVARGLAVTMLPDLALPGGHPGLELRDIAEGPVNRAIFAVTRTTDAERPSTQALLAAVRDEAAAIGPAGPLGRAQPGRGHRRRSRRCRREPLAACQQCDGSGEEHQPDRPDGRRV